MMMMMMMKTLAWVFPSTLSSFSTDSQSVKRIDLFISLSIQMIHRDIFVHVDDEHSFLEKRWKKRIPWKLYGEHLNIHHWQLWMICSYHFLTPPKFVSPNIFCNPPWNWHGTLNILKPSNPIVSWVELTPRQQHKSKMIRFPVSGHQTGTQIWQTQVLSENLGFLTTRNDDGTLSVSLSAFCIYVRWEDCFGQIHCGCVEQLNKNQGHLGFKD